MNNSRLRISATALLLGFISLGLTSGCSFTDTNQPAATAFDTAAASSVEVTAATTIQELGSVESHGVGIALAGNRSSQTITIDTGNPNSVVTTERLTNPDRLVLDISNSNIRKNSAISVTDSTFVNGIRIGSHQDKEANKGRVVIDLASSSATGAPKEAIIQDGQEIQVAFTNIESTEKPIVVASLNEKIDEAIDAPIESIEPSFKPNKQFASTVTSLTLENLPGQGSVVVATLNQLKDFEFKKTAPSEYVATLRGVTISPEALQTLLAPPQTTGIRSVRPLEKNGDVILRVFAQPENELAAVAKDNSLVIRTLNPNIDYMAQAKIEAELPEETKVIEQKTSTTTTEVKVTGGKNDTFASAGSNGNYTGALISLELQDADIDSALRIIAEVSNLNIIASSDVQGKVTLRLQNVPWDQALDVILKTNGLDKVQDGNVVRIAPVEKLRLEREALKQAQLAEDELEPLSVRYVRVSYARAEDVKPLIKSVLSERGDVAVDARSNQLIIKDIKKGIRTALELVSKLDLRTPQVLLETQIIEASRSFLRDLGAQLGFSFIQSPETGNATGWNFPNSVNVGGGIPNSTNASNFPASITGSDGGSAISLAFGSADGTKALDVNISALEREGKIRIISRPSVATTNNKAAEITSNETISVLMPNGGINTVVGGQGQVGGTGPGVATEKIKAGITLKVTPQASPDYFILMDIEAESSNFGSRVVNGIPALFERRATSTVLVSSGQTFAIGGIYRTTDRDTLRGVPFLKDIPVLGNFFSGNTVDVTDEELLFFITPRIIEGSFDDAAMTTEGL